MRHKKFKLITLLLLAFGLMGLQGQTNGTFTDTRDGKVYKTVKIGEQVWMANNLAFKPNSGNYWVYDANTKNIAVYGYLYNWETAKKVCPTGWHLPTNDEWRELTNYLGGDDVAGGKLKETGTTHWESPNGGATNETGFTALPGGAIDFELNFIGIEEGGYWWSATEYFDNLATLRYVYFSDSGIYKDNFDKDVGVSVRCVRD